VNLERLRMRRDGVGVQQFEAKKRRLTSLIVHEEVFWR